MQLAPVITNSTQAQIELTAVIEHSASLFHIDNLHSRNHHQTAASYINISSLSSSSSLSKLLIVFVFFAVFLQLIIVIIITKSYKHSHKKYSPNFQHRRHTRSEVLHPSLWQKNLYPQQIITAKVRQDESLWTASTELMYRLNIITECASCHTRPQIASP